MDAPLEIGSSGDGAAARARPASKSLARTPEALPEASPGALPGALACGLARAAEALLDDQAPDGHWCYELEADCTISAEYVLMMHFLGEVDEPLESRIAAFLREHQDAHDGWSLYPGGDLNVSASVKVYWALKLAGDDPQADHMRRAREAILARGGAARSNVFTRIALALFGEVPWRATPWVPVEIILAPRWFPFHLSRISFWSRTVMVPLSVLCTLRPRAANPRDVHVRELFDEPPERERSWFPVRSRLNRLFLAVERAARLLDPLVPGFVRRRALKHAEAWIVARANGVDGLGGIFPAMVNAYEALLLLGYPSDHPQVLRCREAIDRLLVERGETTYCRPCFSPVWDTALATLALQEAAAQAPLGAAAQGAIGRAVDWLLERQILDGEADWRDGRPDLAPGGWAFQYANPHYPDLDDTAAAVWALLGHDTDGCARAIDRGLDWLRGMQSRNGGFAAYDTDNTYTYLNEIPFADHGALLDPPTADVSARCAAVFSRRARAEDRHCLESVVEYLLREQEPDGAWYGRWGTNYIYGAWSVLSAVEGIDDPRLREAVERAAAWLKSVQRPDGSWGESNDTYGDPRRAGRGDVGTSAQTSWALLALMVAGESDASEVQRGIRWLLDHQRADGLWKDEGFNAPGFPRVFHLRYHGYARYFPVWALARYRRELTAVPR